MDAYRSGTWRKPTSDDQLLFPGLGGYRAVLQHIRQGQSPPPHANSPTGSSSSDGENIMTSLESVQPTLDEYLRSFQSIDPESANTNGQPAPMNIPSSDAFLQSALTGNWNNLNASESDWTSVWEPASGLSGNVQQQSQPPQQQPSPLSVYQPNQPVNYGQSIAPPTFHMSSHSPYSDGGLSTGSGSSTNPPTHAMHFSDGGLPSSTYQPAPVPAAVAPVPNPLNLNATNTNGNGQVGFVNENDKFSWDDFLMQLSMQN
jgi:hypothetical protein